MRQRLPIQMPEGSLILQGETLNRLLEMVPVYAFQIGDSWSLCSGAGECEHAPVEGPHCHRCIVWEGLTELDAKALAQAVNYIGALYMPSVEPHREIDQIHATYHSLVDVKTRIDAAMKRVQTECLHPNVDKKYNGNSGNYDPSADRYWIEFRCPDCGKYWHEDQ